MRLVNIISIVILLSQGCPGFAAETNGNDNGVQKDLFDKPLEDLMQIEVTSASKKKERLEEAPAIITVITKKDIDSFGALSLFDVLNRVTSVYMLGTAANFANMMSMRGDATENSSHILVLMNGRPIIDHLISTNYSSIFQAFPLTAVERIEVIRGPGSVLYGTNAFNGVVNIITRTEDAPTGSVLVRAGSFQTKQVDGFAATNVGDLKISSGLLYHADKGWDFTATDANFLTESRPQYEGALGTTLNADYKNLTFTGVYARSENPFMSHHGTDWTVSGINNLQRGMADVGYKLDLMPEWTSSFHLTFNRYDSYPAFEAPARHVLVDDYLLEWENQVALGKTTSLLIGASATSETGYDQDNAGSGGYYVDPYKTGFYTAFLEVDQHVGESVKLVGGVQANQASTYSPNFVPRLGVLASFTDHWSGKLLYSSAYRAPSKTETDFHTSDTGHLYGDPNFSPETVNTWDAQLAYKRSTCEVAGTLFHSVATDLITPREGASPYKSDASLTFYGAELEGKILVDAWKLTSGGSYQENYDHTGYRDFTHMPNFLWKNGISYVSPVGFDVGIFDVYVGPSKPLESTSQQTVVNVNPNINAYHDLSANVNFDIKKLFHLKMTPKLTANLMAKNTLNSGIYYPDNAKGVNSIPGAPGRAFYGGVGMDF